VFLAKVCPFFEQLACQYLVEVQPFL